MVSRHEKRVLAKSLVGSLVYSFVVFLAIEGYLMINGMKVEDEYLPVISIVFIMSFVLIFNTLYQTWSFTEGLRRDSLFKDITLNDYKRLYPFNVAYEILLMDGQLKEDTDIMHELSKINPSMLNYTIETVLDGYHKDMFTSFFSQEKSYEDIAEEYDTNVGYVKEDIYESLDTLRNPDISQYYTTTTNVLAKVDKNLSNKFREENKKLKEKIKELENN